MPTVKVALDATPLLGSPTGVGRYVESLVSGLAALAPRPEQALVPITWRGVDGLPSATPNADGIQFGRRRVPARLVRELWIRAPWPPMEWLSGAADVVHGTNFVLPPSRAPGVVTVHDLTYLRHPEWVEAPVRRYHRLVAAAVRRGAVVCTPSATVRAEFLDAYPDADPARVRHTPLAVRTEVFRRPPDGVIGRVRTELGLPERYLLFLGALEPRKGLDRLLAAYRLLAGGGAHPLPLVIAGPPGWGEQSGGAPLGELVRQVGYVSATRLPALLSGAAALLYPSRYEGFGLPPLEAFACGVPAIVSDLAVLREVLGDLAEYVGDDPQSWAEAILAAGIGTSPRPLLAAHAAGFTVQRLAETTMAAYRLAIDGRD